MAYQYYVGLVNNLATIKEHKLQGTPLTEELATILYKGQNMNLYVVNQIAACFIKWHQPTDDSNNLKTFGLTPEIGPSSEFLTDKLRPWMLHSRRTLFNSEIAPFDTWEEAWLWFKDELQKAVRENKKLPAGGPVGPWEEYLRQHQEYTPATAFIDEADNIAKVTGFYSTSLLSFVLTDSKPVLSGFELESKEGIYKLFAEEELKYRFITITIKNDISFKDLRSLYQQIRQKLHLTKKKGLNSRHLLIYRLVQSKAYKPLKGKGSVAFWRSVMDEWNKLHPQDTYHGYKGIKRAYELIIRKMRSERFMTS